MSTFEEMLTGGHPNSLGRTEEVVDIILKDKKKLEDLYQTYFSDDAVVRLRVSSSMKRICKTHPDWLVPYVDKFISEISKIDQASTQWTFAQLMMDLDSRLTGEQRKNVIAILKNNLQESDDWIVLNTTMEALAKQAKNNENLKTWLLPQLRNLAKDKRNSVNKRANKFLAGLVSK